MCNLKSLQLKDNLIQFICNAKNLKKEVRTHVKM